MLSEQKLSIIALSTSMIGIFSLAFFSLTAVPQEFSVSELSEEVIGKTISLNAKIQAFRHYNKSTFLVLTDGKSSLNAVLFNTLPEQKKLVGKNLHRAFTGVLQKRKGKFEFVISRIR